MIVTVGSERNWLTIVVLWIMNTHVLLIWEIDCKFQYNYFCNTREIWGRS